MTKQKVTLLITVLVLLLAAFPGFKIIAEALQRQTAYQFSVNGQKWFILSQKDSIEELLNNYQRHYLTDIDKNARIKKIYFAQKVNIQEVRVNPKEIDTLKIAKEKIYAAETEAVVIKVKPGDNFWDIAKANKLSVDKLEILNPDIDPDKIFPGDKLVVKPFNPVLDVAAELENTVVEPIPFKIEYKKDRNLYQNQKKILNEGIEGQKEVRYDITLLNGYQSSLKVKEEKIIKEPVNAVVRIGTKTTVSRGGRINFGVVSGKRLSSLFGYRVHPITGRRLFHDGIDIAARYGNGVYAYSDGKVIQAGWNGGYGNSILIDHGNGLKTRYGHLSKIYVHVGQRVQTSQKIGAAGSTGNSTGPHLHFEVIKNGQIRNPLNYL